MREDKPEAPAPQPWRPSRYLLAAYGLLALTILLFVLTSVILDSALSRLPLATQRWIIVLALILPAVLGALMGLADLTQPRHRTPLALAATLLNALIAAFFIALLAITG
jgi:hypothetical protein